MKIVSDASSATNAVASQLLSSQRDFQLLRRGAMLSAFDDIVLARKRDWRSKVNKVTAVIADDEAHLRNKLRESLLSLWPQLDICAEAADGLQAMQALQQFEPDILFLDIHMPGISGLRVAELADGRSHVVFVTAYDQYAVAAFEQGAADYVIKPFSAERLAGTVMRLKQRVGQPPVNLEGILKTLSADPPRKEYLRWITTSAGSNVRLITAEEVCYFRSDSKYTIVASADSETLIRTSIRELVALVDPNLFWQIHRSTLVNVNAIAAVNRDLGGHLRVSLKRRPETLSVSEPYEHRFRSM